MDGFEHFLDTEAGKDLPDIYAPEGDTTDATAADIAAQADTPPPAEGANDYTQTTPKPEDATADAQAAGAVVVPTNPDQSKMLEEISGGRVKRREDFQTILQKAEKADALEKKISEWTAKYGENPYADSFEETRNQLKKQGATENQLQQLEELTKLGELKDLSPLEIRVKAMVLRDNVNPKIAERIIKEQVGLTDFLNDEDKEYAETKLELSAREDRKYLEEFKDKLKPVDNSTVQLQREAAVGQAKEALKPVSAEVQKAYTEIKDFNITDGKKPEDIIALSLKVPESFNSKIPELMELYTVNAGKPINEQTIAAANENIEGLLWATHGKEFLSTAVNHAIATTTEKLVAKYENRSTLQDDQRAAVVTDDDDEFYKEVAS